MQYVSDSDKYCMKQEGQVNLLNFGNQVSSLDNSIFIIHNSSHCYFEHVLQFVL